MEDTFQTNNNQILIFTLGDMTFALPLKTVVRVIHVVEIKRLPKAPYIISGIINVQGEIIPVVDVRKRLGLEPKETDPDDHLLIADTGKRKIVLMVDRVTDIKDINGGEFVNPKEILPFTENIKGIAKIDNDLILIYDMEKFLSLEEEKLLDQALKSKIL